MYKYSTMSWKDTFIQKKFSQYQDLLVKKADCLTNLDETMCFLAIVRDDKPQSKDYEQCILVKATNHNDALCYLMRYYDVDELREISSNEFEKMENHPMYQQATTSGYEGLLYDLRALERELDQFDEFKQHFKKF